MKKISILVFCFIIMTGVSGCMNSDNNGKSVGEKVLSYMEEKYNEKFDYMDSTDGGFDVNNRTLLISPQKNSNIHIDVNYRINEGNEEYVENYTQIKYRDKTKEFIEQMLISFFQAEVIVDYEYGCSDNDFNETTTFEQFIKNEESAINFYAVVSPDYNAVDMETVKHALTEKCQEVFLYCRGTVCFAREKDEYKSYYELPVWKKDEMSSIIIKIGE